jgi:hypothetical protein
MASLPPEEEKAVLHSAPTGTLFLIVLYTLVAIAAWLTLFFVRHLGAGVVH